MSNNARVNDDEIEIHQLPEVLSLQAGMMVAVDSQPTGTKSFNLTTALEGKVDAPATTPAEGQVLTFNGSANTWANPPEGVYVLNYTEVSDLRDIDIDRAKSQPTFIKIDTNEPINISIPDNMSISIGSVGYSLPLMPGTILKLDEIAPSSTYGEYTGPWCLVFNTLNNRGSFPTYSIGGYGVITIRLMITVPGATSTGPYKVFSVYGKIADGSTFAGMPVPFTEFYSNGRGVGSPSTSGSEDGNALQLKLVNHDGTTRNQCILPLDIQNHNFNTDSTPEQIQFMGWGVTSNRAGYKSCLVATHSDTATYPIQTPEVNFIRSVMGPSETEDNVICAVSVVTKPANGGNSSTFGGILIPRTRPGALQYWSDNNGSHLDFKPVNEVPASTSSNASQVLTVAANGTPGWGNAVGFVKNVGSLTDAATITATTLNNGFATLSTSQSALTIIDVVGTDEIVNFAIEITPSVNCTLTIQKKVGNNSPVPLKHSVAGGNTLEANKTYQVTAVGTCWTLAEFEA